MVIRRHRQLLHRRRKIRYGHVDLYYILIGMLVMIRTPHRRIGIEYDRPLVLLRNGEHRIPPCLYRLAAKRGILRKYKDRRFIGPATIGLAVRRNRSPEDLPSFFVRTAIKDRDVLALDRVMRTVRMT